MAKERIDGFVLDVACSWLQNTEKLDVTVVLEKD